MPPTALDEDDQLVASYNIYLTGTARPTQALVSSKLCLLQYPSYRSSSTPYDAASSEKPRTLKFKPRSGLLELDIPVLTHEHYNSAIASKYGESLRTSRVTAEGGTHGLAGGFNTVSSGLAVRFQSLKDVPLHDGDEPAPQPELGQGPEPGAEHGLLYQTLGGKIKPVTPGDPIYMLGAFSSQGLHLSKLDALTQIRPQLHHVDAQDELDRKRTPSANTVGTLKAKANVEVGPPKVETKAIDIRVKNANDDGRDRGINANAKLLRDIQAEKWQSCGWVDESEDASTNRLKEQLHADTIYATQLKSKLSNSEWLDKMSAPRETGHGKKGLLAKLRGRERERARRKKNEEEKARKAHEQAANGDTEVPGGVEHGVDTDDAELSNLTESEEADVEMIDMTKDLDDQIMEDPKPESAPAPATAAAANLPKKKRGRPAKQLPKNAVTITDG